MLVIRESRILVLLGILASYGCDAGSSDKSSITSSQSTPGSSRRAPTSLPATARAEVASPAANAIAKSPPQPTADQIAKWNIPECEPLQLLACNDGFGDPASLCMAVAPNGKQFVLGGAKLTLWNTSDSQPAADLLEKIKREEVERPIRAVAISDDGKWVAAGDGNGKVRLWTLGDQNELVTIQAHQGHIAKLAFSPDSRLLATTSYSGEVALWQLPEGTKLKTLKASQQELSGMAFVSNNLLAFAGSETGIWNLDTGVKETPLTAKRVINPALGLSRDRRLLAFNDGEVTIRLWDVRNSKPADVELRGAANLIAFSAGGERMATYSNHSPICIWDMASGSIVQVLDACGERVTSLAWLPEANALLVATEYGRVRIWGTRDAATAVGIRPISLPPITPTAGVHRSLSSAQLEKVIDIRAFPRLPGAVPSASELGMCSYAVSASQADAELFYRYVLGMAGWTELPASTSSPGLVFEKDGSRLNVSFSPDEDVAGRPGRLQVSLQFAGNYDVRWLPKIAAVDSNASFDSFSYVMYRTKADMTDVEAAVLRQFHAAGWTAYTRLGASGVEDPRSRSISMLQGGNMLTVSIGHPAELTDELVVSASVHVFNSSLPLPLDSGWIEFDASTDIQFVINTKMDLKQTIDFFDQQMAVEGWLARTAGRQVKDDAAWLPFIRGQQDLFLHLAALPDGGTRIVAGDAARFSWQLQKPPKTKSDKPGIEAADFLLPAGATAVKFDVDAKQIEFEVPDMTPPKLGEQFAAQLESLQWNREGAGIVADDYTFITFLKEKAEIQLRARPAGKKATATISGDGLLWSKPLPTAPVRISYETWLRRNRKKATLDDLDAFVSEMHKIPPQTSK